MPTTADVVICGAGLAGVATAYHLAVRQGVRRVVLIDEREPLSLTSAMGTQGYRNWWPGPDDTMFRFVSRSIDLLEETARESGNVFRLNRRGYLFATADAEQIDRFEATAAQVSGFGMGPVRRHTRIDSYAPAPAEGFERQPVGADLLLGDTVSRAFQFLAPQAVAALHVRRAGTINAAALGDWLLQRAIAAGGEFLARSVSGVVTAGGAVRGVRLDDRRSVATGTFVNAAGPAVDRVGRMLGIELPVFHELHGKVTIHDAQRAVPRDAPFVIWTDPLRIGGELLAGGVHLRPVDLSGGDELFLIWTYETDVRPYAWPPAFDAGYGATVLEGAARMVPALAPYIAAGVPRTVDGGYYCKTRENRPLIGPLPVRGAFVVGALSGIGLMSSHAAGELIAAHVVGAPLPEYARWLLPSRYEDAGYRALADSWGALVGQL
jgi:glycine/D-amino acid oxidase-like deaminating enzyme